MKALVSFLVVVGVSCASMAADITGKWELSSRSCRSGVPVNDNLQKSPKDFVVLNFRTDGTYQSFRRFQDDLEAAEGTYTFNGSVICSVVGKVVSTLPEENAGDTYCLPISEIKLDQLKISIEYANADGGSCPRGDFLDVILKKL